jgi:transcriptional regulator with XRE-family HTH domain
MTPVVPVKPRKGAYARTKASETTQAIGRHLAAMRVDCDLTQAQLAARVGWHKSHVARVEVGYHEITVKTLCTYLRGLGLSKFDLGRFL